MYFDGDKEILTIELLTKSMKTICCYKPFDDNYKNHCDHLQKILTNCTNTLHRHFIKLYSSIYDKTFPLLETYKFHGCRRLWESSKQKQKHYTKFVKSKNPEDERTYKNYKNLFEKLRKKSKQSFHSNLFEKHKDNAKQRWQILK